MERARRIRHLLLIVLLAAAGCTTTIIAPPNPPHPTTVLITDYGRHSSLLLPDADGRFVEYAFGDWDWFALGHTNPIAAIHALIHSPQSTLGRRWVLVSPDSADAAQVIGAMRIETMKVDGDRVNVLRQALDREYAQHIDSVYFNPDGRLFFVRCDEPYNLFDNCNAETAKWLRKLGARVDGPAILSHFRVLPATADNWGRN